MSKSSDSTKIIVAAVAFVVVVTLAAIAAVALRGSADVEFDIRENNPGATADTRGTGGTGSDAAAMTASTTAAGNNARNAASRLTSGGATAVAATGGYIPGSIDISHKLEGRTQAPLDFRPSQRVADALGFRRTIQEVTLPDEAREMLRQYEYDNNDELFGLLSRSDEQLNAAFEAVLASERASSPVTTEKARIELMKTFSEHLKLLHEVNNGYYMEAQRYLDNRGKASLMYQFDRYIEQTIEIPYIVGGTNKPAVTLRGNISQSQMAVVDGDTVFNYHPTPDGTSFERFKDEQQ